MASFELSVCCAFICLKLLFQKAVYIFLEPGKNMIKGLSVGVMIIYEWFLSTHRSELISSLLESVPVDGRGVGLDELLNVLFQLKLLYDSIN